MKKSRLKALVSLLDDPDNLVFETVEKELLKESDTIIPALEQHWENSYSEKSQERIENLIQNLQFKKTKKLLRNWISLSDNDLLEGFIIFDMFQYPEINPALIRHKIEKIKNAVWLELNDSLTLLEKASVLNHFLYNVYGFSINHNNIHSPQNCYLNQILETKRGNPVSLSLFYTILARQLGLSVFFTNFPKNPLIAVVDYNLAEKIHGKDTSGVLFYINPSNKGAIASKKEIDYHLKKNEYTPEEKYSNPQPDTFFIKRQIEWLLNSFRKTGFLENEQRAAELLSLFHNGR